MRNLYLFIAFFVLLFILHSSAFSQAKAARIDPEAFYDEKTGIKKLLEAYKNLDLELSGIGCALSGTAARIETVEREIRPLKPGDKAYREKTKEIEDLKNSLDRERAEKKKLYERREAGVVGPVLERIKALREEFQKEKGYSIIFDGPKLHPGIRFHEAARLTTEFISFRSDRFSKDK